MAKKKSLRLKAKDQKELERLTSSGTLKARKLNRCRILLLAARGKKRSEIIEAVEVSPPTVDEILRRYKQGGLENALNEKPRPGTPATFTGKDKAKITALACSTPPEGHCRWTLRLLADQAVVLDIVDTISHDTVATILKKTNSSRT
jgi:transposase